MASVEQWFNDPGKIGATVLLVSAIVALYRGMVVPRWSYDVMQATLKEQLARAIEDGKVHKDMNLRLLEQMERTVSVTEATTSAAIRATRQS